MFRNVGFYHFALKPGSSQVRSGQLKRRFDFMGSAKCCAAKSSTALMVLDLRDTDSFESVQGGGGVKDASSISRER